MLTRERHAVIAERLRADGKVLAADLAGSFAVSEDTIRRDLREMAAAGLCERVYGGALARIPAPAPPPLAERLTIDGARRDALASAASPFLTDGATIFIDAGSANAALAAQLPADRRYTIVTHSPAVALAVSPRPQYRVTLLGGRYDAEVGACLGCQVLGDVERLRPDILVLGACALDMQAGVTAFDPEDAAIKRRLAKASGFILVLATAEKLGTIAPFAIIEAKAVDRLITEEVADGDSLATLRESGIAITVAATIDSKPAGDIARTGRR